MTLQCHLHQRALPHQGEGSAFLSASLIWEWAQSQEQILLRHSALGKTKKSHMGKRKILGKRITTGNLTAERKEGKGTQISSKERSPACPTLPPTTTTTMSAK